MNTDFSAQRPSALPLAITCGDPAGVGPEIIARWLETYPAERARVAVIGPASWLETLPCEVAAKVAVGDTGFGATPGQPGEAGARVARDAMEHAAAGCLAGAYSGVVTGPVSKAWLARVGYPYPGQTEFFAARWGKEGGGGGDA
ncbi:MAG: 4-hydroxythreonine-4-phosphate dehydrogenase PdxA, partial [Opitutaceae bacterium]|nr:4-hydroxythreonine-4-phosphate dehydrogenase PdxA [Opitutaceae bacterium]